MQHPEVSIIVLSYNGLFDTRRCLRSILSMTYPNLSIYIVDNGSRKDEKTLLKKEFSDPRIRYVQHAENLGYTGGNNEVIKKARGKYIAFINNDVIVTECWLEDLVNYMESHPKVAVTQPKILWQRNKAYFDYAGACGGYIDMYGYPFTRGRIFNTLEKDKGQYDEPTDIFWASGAAMVVRRNIFKKVGVFDTRFFNYMEEIDLCYRINRAGYRIVCLPQVQVYHKGASTSSKNELKKRFWEHRNNMLMITKNFSPFRLMYILPIRFVLEYLSIFYYLSHKRADYAAAVLLSQLSYFHMAPGILFSRLSGPRRKRYNAERKMFGKSIVFTYFFLRKQTFSQVME